MSRSTIYLFAFALLIFALPYHPDQYPHIDQADLFTDSGTIPSAATICGDADPHQVQPVYVLTSTDNYTQSIPVIQSVARQIDGIFVASSAGRRHVRFALQGDCEISVGSLKVSRKASGDFDTLMEEARSAGMDQGDRKYLLFVDDPGFECGTARVSRDNTKGDLNQSNHAYLYAAVGRSCWVAKAAAHELIHVLGGVQDDAPHSSHGWHCTDEHDIMCYSDLPFYPAMSFPCTSPAQEHLIDCNGDDYFNVNPPIGSYLADHWNVADSMFLIKVEPMLWLAGIVK